MRLTSKCPECRTGQLEQAFSFAIIDRNGSRRKLDPPGAWCQGIFCNYGAESVMFPEVRHPDWHLVGSRITENVAGYLRWIAMAAKVLPGVVIDVDPYSMGAGSRIPIFDATAARLDEVGVAIMDGLSDAQITNLWPRVSDAQLTIFRALIADDPPPRFKP